MKKVITIVLILLFTVCTYAQLEDQNETPLTGLGPAKVGDLRVGGVVFWVNPTDNRHGLVCAFTDYAGAPEWGCFRSNLPNVSDCPWNESDFDAVKGRFATGPGAEIGDGMANTASILYNCPTSPAALAARSYGPEWFLPSANELMEMSKRRATLEAVTGFSPFYHIYTYYNEELKLGKSYWSSTETKWNAAWAIVFGIDRRDGLTPFNKTETTNVRAVRAF